MQAYISDGVGSEPSHVGTVSDTSDLTYTFGGLTTSYTYEVSSADLVCAPHVSNLQDQGRCKSSKVEKEKHG
eukprot:233346-Amphidinium_carterae.1